MDSNMADLTEKLAQLPAPEGTEEAATNSTTPNEKGDGQAAPSCSTPNSSHHVQGSDSNHCSLKTVSQTPSPKPPDVDCSDPNYSVPSDCVGSMKKDDSGISIEKSPVKENSLVDDSGVKDCKNVDSSTLEDGLFPGTTNRPSTSNESEGLVADIDTEDSEPAGSYSLAQSEDVAMGKSDSESKDCSDEEDEEGVAEDGEAREEVSNRDERGQRRKRQSRYPALATSSSSSSSSSTSGPDDVDDVDMNENDSDEATDVVGETGNLKDTWHPLFEIRKRELGFGNQIHSSGVFSTKAGASINLVKRLERHKTLEHHDGCVNALHFNQSGTLLASGSDDLNIVVWNWVEGKPYFVFDSGHRSNVFQSKFMPYTGDTHIVSCARDGQVRLAELSSTGTCKGTRKLAQHRGAAHKLSLLQDSSHVFYSCGEDAVAFEIDLRQEKPNKMCVCKEGERKVALYSIHANPFKSYEFCVGGRDHFVRVYDKRKIDNGDISGVGALKKFCPHHLVDSDIKANVTCAVYNYNGSDLIGTYNDEDIYMFNNEHSDGAQYIHKYSGHRNNATVKGVNFYGPKSEFIVSGSDCGNVFFWERESEEVVQYFHADDGGVINVLEPHPHCPIIATSGLDHDVKVWMPSAKEPTKLAGIKRTMKRNRRDREEERNHDPEMVDGQMLWFLMQQLRRSARRRRRDGEDDDEMPRLGTSDSDDDSEEDSDGPNEQMQCVPS